MTYQRVTPRDLFNEAKLLKCLGKLIIEIENQNIPLQHVLEIPTAGFEVGQDDSDGSIFVSNLTFKTKSGKRLYFYTSLNARENWPLLCTDVDSPVVLRVFDDDDGTLLLSFINTVRQS